MQGINRRHWIGAAAATSAALLLPMGGRAAAAAASGSGYRVLVTNEHTGTLSVIDGLTQSVVETIPLGKRPRGLKASFDGKLLYVALSGSPIAGPGVDEKNLPAADKTADGIGIVDLASLKLVRVLRGVSDPEQLAVSRDGRHLYVASEDTGRGVVLDTTDAHVVASVDVGGEPEGVSLSPNGRFVYMTSEEDHKVSVIDTATHRVVASINVGQRPRFTEFSDDGRIAYISAEIDGTIAVVDTTTNRKLRTLKLEGVLARPVGMVVSHDGKQLYVVTGRGQKLLALDAQTGKVLSSVEVGPRPWGVVLSPDGKTLYTANGSSNDVSVVDVATFSVTKRIAVGGSPWGLIIVPTG